jgi:hypothetical protein
LRIPIQGFSIEVQTGFFIPENLMATYTPPPYFPQSSLSPPDEKRYRKFKLMVVGLLAALLAIVGGAITGIVYLVRWLAH